MLTAAEHKPELCRLVLSTVSELDLSDVLVIGESGSGRVIHHSYGPELRARNIAIKLIKLGLAILLFRRL